MSTLILENGSAQRQHRPHLIGLLNSTKGLLRVATAYLTDRDILFRNQDRERHLLVSLLPMDIASGATSLDVLGALIRSGVRCRKLPDRPRMHAKVYIFADSHAVVTSANLTVSAFDSNIEVGVDLGGDQVKQLAVWFDGLWEIACPVTLEHLSELQKMSKLLRSEYIKFRKKANSVLKAKDAQNLKGELSDRLQDLLTSARQFFICNTNRKYDERNETNSYKLEDAMFSRGFACAWDPFRSQKDMEQVNVGDAIFLYAKGIGIIGIGQATGKIEVLEPNDPDQIRNNEFKSRERRIPVIWLKEASEADAYKKYKSQNFTFRNITGSRYDDLREDIKIHFLAGT